jgi:hypothetical protein
MAYADTTRLDILLKEYDYASDADLVTEGCTQGDNRVDRYLNDNIEGYTTPTPTPQDLVDAATLFTASAILDILLSNQDKRSPASVKWEELAIEILQGYVNEYLSENEDSSSRGATIRFLAVTAPEE